MTERHPEQATTGWRSVGADHPGWDAPAQVDVKRADNTTVSGRLVSDAGFDGEDEFPIWTVVLPDGTEVSIHEFEEWRPHAD